MDGVHVAFMRVMVCVGLTQAIASANVANFAMDADRRAHVICRMLVGRAVAMGVLSGLSWLAYCRPSCNMCS